MNADFLISQYEALSSLIGKMRSAADQADWEQLISFEQQYHQLTSDMRSAGDAPKPDESTRQHIDKLIRKILSDDAEIRKLTETRMEQLQIFIQSSRQEQRLNQAYNGK